MDTEIQIVIFLIFFFFLFSLLYNEINPHLMLKYMSQRNNNFLVCSAWRLTNIPEHFSTIPASFVGNAFHFIPIRILSFRSLCRCCHEPFLSSINASSFSSVLQFQIVLVILLTIALHQSIFILCRFVSFRFGISN